MLENQITLVGNFNYMLRGTRNSLDQNLIKQLPNATAFVDAGLEVIFASDKWMKDFGFCEKDIQGKTLLELFGDIRSSWKNDLDKVLDGKGIQTGIESFISPKNNEKWFNWTNAPWIDEAGNIIGIIIQTEDITHQIFDSAKLEKLEILLNDKTEISRIGSWQYDAVRKELLWCDITKEIHEVPSDFMPDLEKGINFYKEGYSRNTIAMAVDKAIQKGIPWQEKLQIITANGKEKWVNAAGKPIFKDDKFLGLIGTFQDITDDIVTQTKTEEQERLFKSIFNSSYQFTGILDVDGTFLKVNETALKFSGMKEDDILGKKFWDAYWWPIPDMVKDGLKNVILAAAGGKLMRSEISVLDQNQNPIPVDFSLKPIYDENNQVVSLLAEGRMIKEMVQAREKLKVSEQKFRALYELSPIGYVLSDLETGEVLDFNSAFTQATGYAPEDLGSLHYKDLVPDSKNLQLSSLYTELNESGIFGPYEHEYNKKDGTKCPVLISGSIVNSKKGQKLLWSTAQDLTDLRKKEKQIREERKLLKTLIDNLPLNVFIKDLDSKKVLVNKAELNFCGLKNESEILGKDDFNFYDRDTANSSREEDLRVMNSLTPMLGQETINVKKDGTITTFLTSKIPLIGDDGKANGLIGISMDISDLKQKERELQDLINVTSHQNKQLINFAHIVSHNLRSHTANFSMLLEFLVNEQDEKEKENLVKMLTEASDNLLETLDNLNEVVAISTNINLEKKPVSLNEKIDVVEQNLAAFLKKNKAKIINEIPQGTMVRVIPAYLDSILMNFITNAVKYKDPNRSPIIKLTLEKTEQYTILSIQDNGLGIDLNKYGTKLFGMYKTFHDNPDARGIGLYITKNQIEAMNGRIEVASELGTGTTFNIFFNEKN